MAKLVDAMRAAEVLVMADLLQGNEDGPPQSTDFLRKSDA
jgi:hypothetical protein